MQEDNKEMRGLKNWKKGSMGTSCRVLGKGQGTFCMDKRRTIYPQERREGQRRKHSRLDLDRKT